MKILFILIAAAVATAISMATSGCLVTGGLEYHDAKTGARANLGISHEFKPRYRADAKRVIPRE